MNQNDLASLLSSVGSGGAPGLMQGSHRGRVLPGSSTQPATSLLDAFSQQTPDSRPNTAPAGTRGGPKGGAIQMSALSNILANLSANNPNQGASSTAAAAAAAKPAIDLYDIMTTEVNLII
jgi:hypothetical protein